MGRVNNEVAQVKLIEGRGINLMEVKSWIFEKLLRGRLRYTVDGVIASSPAALGSLLGIPGLFQRKI